jgi:hypothetical protein
MEVKNILRNQVFAPQSACTRQQANYPEGHTIPAVELFSVCTYHDHHAHTHCPGVGTKLKVGTKATLYSDAVSNLPDAPVVAAAIPQGEQLNGLAAAGRVRLRIAQTTHHAQPSAQQLGRRILRVIKRQCCNLQCCNRHASLHTYVASSWSA